ncbi:MAG: hypothetical protein KDA92_03125 [Planctomycetales bacterium]|nr:hypothetical protein [Planctomycetales bacterium]MCA9172281.1 hypothetical protein [Planctomycetales bacterium]
MTILLEQPLVILFVGAIFVAIAAIVWTQTQQPRAFFAMLACIAAVAGSLLLEHFVVTTAEEVEYRLHEVARALEANDIDRVLTFVSADSTELQAEIRRSLRMVNVKKISIKSNLKIQIGASGKSAEAKFNAVATLVAYGSETVLPRRIVVNYRLEAGQWQVVNYEAFDPRGEHIPKTLRDAM